MPKGCEKTAAGKNHPIFRSLYVLEAGEAKESTCSSRYLFCCNFNLFHTVTTTIYVLQLGWRGAGYKLISYSVLSPYLQLLFLVSFFFAAAVAAALAVESDQCGVAADQEYAAEEEYDGGNSGGQISSLGNLLHFVILSCCNYHHIVLQMA
jgi:hypothetical protein